METVNINTDQVIWATHIQVDSDATYNIVVIQKTSTATKRTPNFTMLHISKEMFLTS